MARCIVTGGAGFIGSHVVDRLIAEGHHVVVIDNLSTGKRENLNPHAIFVEGDICNPLVWMGLPDFDYVFHLAALARIQPSINDPMTSNEVNLVGTLRALEYCRENKAKLIFSGSSSIYQGEPTPTKEADPKYPKSPYAMQKLMCEQYIRLYADLFGVKYTVLRYFNVYGERQLTDGAYAAVVGIFLNQKEAGESLTITNDGEQRRDFTYVKDVARANYMAMFWEKGTYNIGTGRNYSMNEIAKFVGGDIKYVGERKGEARITLADNSKAKAEGWFPSVDIKEWVYETLK